MTAGLAAAAVVALVVAAVVPAVPPSVGAPCLVLGPCLVVAASHWRRRALLVLVAVGLVTVGATGLRLHRLQDGPLPAAATAAVQADVTVRVVGEPSSTIGGGWRMDVAVLVADGRASGLRAELTTTEPLVYGATYIGTAEVRQATGPWRRNRHVAVRLVRPELDLLRGPGALVAGTTRVREGLATVAAEALPAGAAGLATGLVTGDTSLLPASDDEAMRATGLTHLTAVSGSNVALVVAGAWLVAGAAGLGARGRRRLAVVVVLVFALLTRADPSVLRASAMALVVLLAQARGRRVRPLHALSGAVLLLVLLDPLLARRLGMLLSAAATLGVLVVAPRVRARMAPLEAVVRPRRALDLLAVTLGAQVAVLPVLLTTGEEVALATVPANLVAVPLAAAASVLCTAAAVIALPLPGLAVVLLRLAAPPLSGVLWSARSLQWWGPTIGLGTPAVLALTVAVVVWLLATAGSAVSRTAAAMVVLAGVVVVVPPSGPPSGAFVLTAIDVGQGDAFLLTAGDAAVLVDTGRDRRAASWLRRHGPADLDLLVFTHADTDHTGGGAAVLDAMEVHAVWERPRDDARPPALAAAVAAAQRQAAPVHAPSAGQQARVGPLLLRVLAPPGATTHTGLDAEENEASLVLRVDGPGGSVLLTGDTGPAAQTALLDDPATRALLDVDVVTVPHHGSRHVDLALYEATTAGEAVVSVGGDNRYGHPAPEVLEAVRATGARVHRTDTDGTVHVEVSRDSGRVRDDALLHPGDLRRPAAAAAGHRTRAGRPARGRRRRAHRRRRGGPAGRSHHFALRWRHGSRAALQPGSQRRRARRGQRAGRVARRHPRRGGRRARFRTTAQDAEDPGRACAHRWAHRDVAAARLGRRAVGAAGRRRVP